MSHMITGLIKIYVELIPSRCLSLVFINVYYTHSRTVINPVECESDYNSYTKDCLNLLVIMSVVESIFNKVTMLQYSC